MSNRQKLLSLKRHSGYLKRPEILETVYSVEESVEDGEGAQQSQQHRQYQAQQEKSEKLEGAESKKECAEKPCSIEAPPTGSESGTGDTSSFMRSPATLARGFRPRVDSDITVSDDCSTDDDSTRIFYSETSTECSCFSQPDSRNLFISRANERTRDI